MRVALGLSPRRGAAFGRAWAWTLSARAREMAGVAEPGDCLGKAGIKPARGEAELGARLRVVETAGVCGEADAGEGRFWRTPCQAGEQGLGPCGCESDLDRDGAFGGWAAGQPG